MRQLLGFEVSKLTAGHLDHASQALAVREVNHSSARCWCSLRSF
jgi:hypothetical protein